MGRNDRKTRLNARMFKRTVLILFGFTQKVLDRLSAKWIERLTLKEIGTQLRRVWAIALAIGIIFYIVRYKLELEKYFPSYEGVVETRRLVAFFTEKWEMMPLVGILFATLMLLNQDNGKYVEHAENCFSRANVPMKWKVVRGRYIIVWVVFSNILIFLAAAYFIDNVTVFCGLFMLHHLNAVAWLVAFRWNVRYYFYAPRYMPLENDPHRRLILKRRKVMEIFLCKTSNIERECLTATAYGASLLLALANEAWNLAFQAAPQLIVATAEATNQFFSYIERRERNRGLENIAQEERRISDPDSNTRKNLS